MPSLPSGTLTFLFTDIAGSTRLWDTQHDAMKQAHTRQADLIAAAVQAHNGHLVRSRGEGDSTFSVFTSPAGAVRAACDFQRALQAEAWPTDKPLRVRAALHLGPAELREGDYNSTAVNRCARLRALAVGGQTLLSQAVADETRDALPEGAMLHSLGSHLLKDLQRAEQVYQLCHPELPDDFPPLRSLGTLPTNLPQQFNSFVGRETEMRQLVALLTPDVAGGTNTARLLTLFGTGGAGKTRLALQTGAELLDAYPDGVWMVELATLQDAGLVVQMTARALGPPEESGRSSLETLLDTLRERTLLLILDNCEHVVAACADLAHAILRAAPNARLLATSREALNIAGETVWPIPSLTLPDEGLSVSPADVSASEAARLFIDRAQAVLPGFTVTESSAAAVAQISRRLDGIPLALELAAARVRSLSAEQIADRLDDRFQLLTGGSRTALPRQKTLRGLMDWSYDLLNETEKALFARLSVFSGGWSLAACESVCGAEGIDAYEVLDLLSSLVDKSLVMSETKEAEVRFRMLETVRQYAAEKRRESQEDALFGRRHRDWFLKFVEEARPNLNGPEQAKWLDALALEHDNIRAGLAFCLELPGEAEAGLRLAVAMQRFWIIRGHLFEARERFSLLLSHPETQQATPARAAALQGAGTLAWSQGDYAQARVHYEESLSLKRELGDRKGIAASLNNLGLLAYEEGDYANAGPLLEETLSLHRELGDRHGMSATLNNLGNLAWAQGDFAQAWALHAENLVIRREAGNMNGVAMTLTNLSNVANPGAITNRQAPSRKRV